MKMCNTAMLYLDKTAELNPKFTGTYISKVIFI